MTGGNENGQLPVLDLASAFDADYFVGAPPTANTQQPNSINGSTVTTPGAVVHDRLLPNPWNNSPSRPKIRKGSEVQRFEEFYPPDLDSEPPAAVLEPVPYTPAHPSEIVKESVRTHKVAYTRHKRATLQPNISNMESRMSTPLITAPRVTYPVIKRASPAMRTYPAPQRQPTFQAQITNPSFGRPTFSGQPLFTHPNYPPSNDLHQLPQVPQSTVIALPPPAHASISCQAPNPLINQRYAIPIGAHGSLPGGLPIRGPNFQSMAQPVRSAMDDFMRQISNASMSLVSAPSQTPSNLNHLFSAILTNQAHQNDPTPMTSAETMNSLLSGTSQVYVPKPPPPKPPNEDDMAAQDIEADAGEDENFKEVETYSDYLPAKLTFGHPHPDPVVETSSLSTVEPPDITYKLSLPTDVINKARLSSLQLESVVYAGQQHELMMADGKTRRGFLIGDGAGVGKGRTIAGIIYDNYICGRKKSIWLSVSTDLHLDAIRDLRDIGLKEFADNDVRLLKEFQYGKRITIDEGVMFLTYSGLVSKSHSTKGYLGSRLGQLIAWVGSDFDGLIVFDECHKAKNISTGKKDNKPISQTAKCVLELQTLLPNARVVYASATGASEPRHLGYMVRLGMWGPGTAYSTFNHFCTSIEKRGVGAMELVAVELKMRGSYIARQLSFKTTSFSLEIATLDEEFTKLYDECVDMWALALANFREVETVYQGHKRLLRTLWSSFWAAHQKFFKYLCISAKVPVVVKIVEQAIKDGKCVVVGLQSTGEAKTVEAFEDGEINEFVSTAKATFESLIDNHFPVPPGAHRVKRATSTTDSDVSFPPVEKIPIAASNNLSRSDSSSTVDDLWASDSCKFVVDNGIAMPVVTRQKKESKVPAQNRIPRNKRNAEALEDLVAAQRGKVKSSRAVRARRRATNKSRIKRGVDSSSDTELSNILSSSSTSIRSPSSDGTYTALEKSESDEDTIYEQSGSDEELCVIGTKKARASKLKKKMRTMKSSDDSEDDIQITAIKTRKLQEVVIIDDDDYEKDISSEQSSPYVDPTIQHGARLISMRDQLIDAIEKVGPRLPNNTLDDLIDRLGGPEMVAEMTGRKGRIVKNSFGIISYKQRNEVDSLETMNIAEKERFMNGEKYIAIISEAASSGISLQADKRVKNQRRRVHITIELPWSADRAIQQFGRTHRSNQLSGPEYVFIISEMAGERRFASIVAKRLECLGALTHGDRRATSESRDLSQFHISSKFCRPALERLNRFLEGCSVQDTNTRISPCYEGNFLRDARDAYVGSGLGKYLYTDVFVPESQALQINIFLNRILGMRVRIQNAIFKLFSDYVDRLILRKKIAGNYDSGILELNSESGQTQAEPPENFFLKTKTGNVPCTLRRVKVNRGISWEQALEMYQNRSDEDRRSGFYTSTNSITRCVLVFLIIREGVDLFRVYKPNVGRMPKPEYYSNIIQERKTRISEREAKKIWRHVYESTDKFCVHICFFKNCKRQEARLKCNVGMRHLYYTILSGSILTAWPYLEKVIPEATGKLQIVRLRLDPRNRVIGPIIPQDYVDGVRSALRKGEEEGVNF